MAKLPSEVYKNDYIACRRDTGFGHGWWLASSQSVNQGWRIVLVCLWCKTKKEILRSNQGRNLWSRYEYPKGYHLRRTSIDVLDMRKQLERSATSLLRYDAKIKTQWRGPAQTKHNAKLKLVQGGRT